MSDCVHALSWHQVERRVMCLHCDEEFAPRPAALVLDEQAIYRAMENDAAMEAAAKQIDAYVPLTAGNYLAGAAAFRDALIAFYRALRNEQEDE